MSCNSIGYKPHRRLLPMFGFLLGRHLMVFIYSSSGCWVIRTLRAFSCSLRLPIAIPLCKKRQSGDTRDEIREVDKILSWSLLCGSANLRTETPLYFPPLSILVFRFVLIYCFL